MSTRMLICRKGMGRLGDTCERCDARTALGQHNNMDLDPVLLLLCFLHSKTISLYAAVPWKPFIIVFSRLIHRELRVELFDFDILPQETEFQQLEYEKQSEWALKDASVSITLYRLQRLLLNNFLFTVPSPNQSNSVQSEPKSEDSDSNPSTRLQMRNSTFQIMNSNFKSHC